MHKPETIKEYDMSIRLKTFVITKCVYKRVRWMDMNIIGVDLINTENNSSRFTFVTKNEDYTVQLDNKSYKESQA